MGETNMGRYRNPRYAPEFLERKLSPTAIVAPAPMVFVPTAAPDPADTSTYGSGDSAADSSPDDLMMAASFDGNFFGGGPGSGDGGAGDGSGGGSGDGSGDGDGDGWGPDGEPPFLPPAYMRSGPAVAY
jgi:hypothetical protein